MFSQMPAVMPGLSMSSSRFSTMPVKPGLMNIQPPFYAKGGHAKLRFADIIDLIQDEGEGDDTILAHISPEEAHYLSEHYGHDVNPITGLPQFGFFKKIGKFLKSAAPYIGTVIGNMVGGPVGGTIGGTLGGIVQNKRNAAGKRNVFDNAVRGAGIGGLTSAGIAGGNMLLGNSANAGLPDIFGMKNLFGMGKSAPGAPSANGSGSGLGTAAGVGGGLANFANIKEMAQTKDPGVLAGLTKDPLSLALLLASIGGTAMSKTKPVKEEPPEILKEVIPKTASTPLPRIRETPRSYIAPPKGYRGGVDPEHQYFTPLNVEYYEEGGYVDHHGGGQDDDVNARLSGGEYVMDADVVSALGDGNNEAGAKKLDKFREAVRTHKRSAKKNKIPPKAKPVSNYMRVK